MSDSAAPRRVVRWTLSSRMERELETLGERLERMEKQIQRAGREQFRSNALIETTQQKLGTVLDTIKVLDEARNRQVEEAREALEGARTAGRVAFFTRFLPAMDSLEEALAAGRRQLAGWVVEPAQDLPPSLGWGQRLSWAWKLLRGSWAPWEAAAGPRERLRPESLASWLTGLELLRERLLEQFAEEGIHPMVTVGEPFDPQRHLAFKTVPPADHPPGTIVEEVRCGYELDGTVLRYAEVVVAK